MYEQEHLLTILSEECSELALAITKALRFGLHEQRDLPTSNRERMQGEFNDILGVIDMLNDKYPDINLHRDPKLIRKKLEKVERYMKYSRELGTISPLSTPTETP